MQIHHFTGVKYMHVTFNSLSDKNKLSDKKVIKAQTKYVQLFGSQYLIYDFDTA